MKDGRRVRVGVDFRGYVVEENRYEKQTMAMCSAADSLLA
jgi:hypothetical protein